MKHSRQPEKIWKQNKGVTLVEVLIVIAILAIMTGAAGISISLLYSRNAEKCAKTVNTMLETARMNSLAKSGTYYFALDTEDHECRIEPGVESKELPERVNITLESEGSYDLSVNTEIEIEFDKSTGKVKALRADSVPVDIKTVSVIRIHAVNTQGKMATVVLVTATGKHFVEYGS